MGTQAGPCVRAPGDGEEGFSGQRGAAWAQEAAGRGLLGVVSWEK